MLNTGKIPWSPAKNWDITLPTSSSRKPSHPFTFSSLSSNFLLHPWPRLRFQPKTEPPTSQNSGNHQKRILWTSVLLSSCFHTHLCFFPGCSNAKNVPPLIQGKQPPASSLIHFRDMFFSLQWLPFSSSFSTSSLPPAFKQLRCLYLPLSIFSFFPQNFLNSLGSQTHCPFEFFFLNSFHSPPFLTSHWPLSPLQPGFCQTFHWNSPGQHPPVTNGLFSIPILGTFIVAFDTVDHSCLLTWFPLCHIWHYVLLDFLLRL